MKISRNRHRKRWQWSPSLAAEMLEVRSLLSAATPEVLSAAVHSHHSDGGGGSPQSQGWDGAGLGSAALTYYVGAVPNGFNLSSSEVQSALTQALAAWSSVVNVTFTPTTTAGRADSIDFTFLNIDGVNDTLAYAYFPVDVNSNPIAGDIAFDSSESWEIGNAQGSAAIDFLLVAVHEIGHAIGLDHLTAAGSVMRATVSASDSFTALANADIVAAQTLYAAVGTPATPDPSPYFSVVDRVLTVTGTDTADRIEVKPARGSTTQFTVSVNGESQTFELSAIDRIFINSLAGNDRVSVLGSIATPMTVDGGVGDDFIQTGNGNDNVLGGDGKDVLGGGLGNDTLDGGAGSDWLNGQNGDDSLSGGDGNDQAWGGAGNDYLDGGAGDDILRGEAGQDQLFGQAGNDTLEGGADTDTLDGGDGTNSLSDDGSTGTGRFLPRPPARRPGGRR